MKSTKRIGLWMGALATLCFGVANVQAATFHLVNSACGTWDSAGHHTVGDYFCGYSTERPNLTLAYFVFDFTSIKGRTVTGCTTTILGTTDYNITDVWTNHVPVHQFKVGMGPSDTSRFTLNNVLNGMPNPADNWQIQHYEQSQQDLGYAWVTDGLHKGQQFDTFHYNTSRLQNAVNAGGRYPIIAKDRYDSGATNENYIWGGSHLNSSTTLNITVR